MRSLVNIVILLAVFAIAVAVSSQGNRKVDEFYSQNEAEILELASFAKGLKYPVLSLEFDAKYQKLDYLEVMLDEGVKIYRYEDITPSLVKKYFDTHDIYSLRARLKSLGFLSISVYNDRVEMITSRFWLGAFILHIYDEPFTQKELENIAKDRDCYLINSRVLRESDAGATGGGCFFR